MFSFRIYIPAPDHYTPLEKLLLPFDFWTWITISTSAVATIILVTVVNGLKQTKDVIIFYASYPLVILEATRIIFGIRHSKSNTSWRLILMILVVWFFAIRTIYVTKMVEFIVLGVQKPAIKTLDELRARNIRLLVSMDLYDYVDIDSDGRFFG